MQTVAHLTASQGITSLNPGTNKTELSKIYDDLMAVFEKAFTCNLGELNHFQEAMNKIILSPS